MSVDPGARARGQLPSEFRQAFCIPVAEPQIAALAGLAERFAEPEIAVHIAAFTDQGSLLEWFDALGDPIAVSSSVTREAVSEFARRLGATHDWVAAGD